MSFCRRIIICIFSAHIFFMGFPPLNASINCFKNCCGDFIGGISVGGFTTDVPANLYNIKAAYARNPELVGLNTKNRTDDNIITAHAYFGYHCERCEKITLGMECGYRYFGQVKRLLEGDFVADIAGIPTRKIDAQGFDFLFLGKYTCTSGINFFGKVGAIVLRTKVKDTNFIPFANPVAASIHYFKDYSQTYYNIAPEWVVGIGYPLNSCINLTFSFTGIYTGIGLEGYSSTTYFLSDLGGSPSFNILEIGIERIF